MKFGQLLKYNMRHIIIKKSYTKYGGENYSQTLRFPVDSLPHYLHDFWRKIFYFLYSINWPNVIVWLPLFCEIISWERKELLRWNKKHFSSFLKGFYRSKSNNFSLVAVITVLQLLLTLDLLSIYKSFKMWFSTCNKNSLNVITCCCPN